MEKLSTKEIRVLNLVKVGMTNKEIAKQLGMSISSVKLYVSAFIRKLGAKNRINAVYIAYLNKIID